MLVSNEKIEVWGLVMMRSEPGIKKVKTIFENREISYSIQTRQNIDNGVYVGPGYAIE